MTLDKIVRSIISAIVLMFVVGAVTIVVAIDFGNVSKSWYDGTVLKVSMGFYTVLMFAIFVMNITKFGSEYFPQCLLMLVLPIAFFVGIDLPPQGLVYSLMLLYIGIVVYWTLYQLEHRTPKC